MKVKEGLQDTKLICCDCHREFIFSIGEQRYFASKGLSVPRRCPKCRLRRKRTLVPEHSCDSCAHRLGDNLCNCREPEDIPEHNCPDWRPQ